MGRTTRVRSRKKRKSAFISLDHEVSIIELRKWMKTCKWENTNFLKLALFEGTGRGVTSHKFIKENDVIIEVPYQMMITLTTLENSSLGKILAGRRLKMHDILSIFVALERHKGNSSNWKTYLDSFPRRLPPMPWLCTAEEVQDLPKDLQNVILDKVRLFTSSWERSKESIQTCECCSSPGHCVLTLNSFTWAYAMVNTRAVYVDPDIVRRLSSSSIFSLNSVLSDDPCMALCPYLDMFNHSNKAATFAKLEKREGWAFQLTTAKACKKYEEIFISYGGHDNVTLLCEYGFFIPDDELEQITFSFEEIMGHLKFALDARQYKFIQEKNLTCNLFVRSNGISFNLKALFFVVLNTDVRNWHSFIYSEHYTPGNLLTMNQWAMQLTEVKMVCLSKQIDRVRESFTNPTESFQNVINYLCFKVRFMERMLTRLCK